MPRLGLWRVVEHNGATYHHYTAEVRRRGWFGRVKWSPLLEWHGGGGESWWDVRRFGSEDEAERAAKAEVRRMEYVPSTRVVREG